MVCFENSFIICTLFNLKKNILDVKPEPSWRLFYTTAMLSTSGVNQV